MDDNIERNPHLLEGAVAPLQSRRDATEWTVARVALQLAIELLVLVDVAIWTLRSFLGGGSFWKRMLSGLHEMDNRAQTNLTGLMIGILIAAIVAIQVFIPVVNDAIASSNATGTTKTILELLPLFAALLVLVSQASPLMRRL
jgi:hypothetical protein